MHTDTSNQVIVVTQHRFNRQWYGIIRYQDGTQSEIFGPYNSNRQAVQTIQGFLSESPQEKLLTPPFPATVPTG